MNESVTVYQIVNELKWVKYSLESAKKNAGMDFEFLGLGWNIPADTKEWLLSQGYKVFEYKDKGDFMKNLYAGWRGGFKLAETEIVVPIAGDMAFFRGWLKNLVRHADPKTLVNCYLIERGAMPSYHTIRDFGIPPHWHEKVFELYAKSIYQDAISQIGVNLTAKPYACYKSTYLELGGEPDEIIDGVTGDVYFLKQCQKNGIKLLRSWDSIVYHWQRQASVENPRGDK